MKEYFYLISSLHDLELDSQKKLPSLSDFLDFCETQLTEKEFSELKKVFVFNDILNVIKISNESEFSGYLYPTYYSKENYLENLKDAELFFPFISVFLDHKKNGKREFPHLQEIDELVFLFYENLDSLTKNRFLKKYFLFELDLRNTITFLSAKKMEMDTAKYLIPFGDAYERLSKSMTVENAVPGFDNFIESLNGNDMIATEKWMDNIRWQWLDNEVGNHYFSFAYIISYAVKLLAVERWRKLTDVSGKNMLDTLISKIKAGIVFSDEFLKSGGKR